MIKDECDVIDATVRHLAGQVDGIIVSDNDSSDGTWQQLLDLESEGVGVPLMLRSDPEPAYWQSAKMTSLADQARNLGYDWGLFCDADEMWIADDGRAIRDWLLGIPPDVAYVKARIFHYIPTSADPAEGSPFERIGWRLAEPAALPKVGARLVPGLVVEAGNHGVLVDEHRPPLFAGGLRVNHYSWRSETQFAKKIVNGARAYALTDLPDGVGAHWRMWGDPYAADLPARAARHFRRHFFADYPPMPPGSGDRRGLKYDPAMIAADEAPA